MSTNNKISNLVYSQLPFFVRNDHPNFVAFLEAYYEYLEQDVGNNFNGKVVERSKNLQNYGDIDKTLDIFADKLFWHFLNLIPRETLADRDKLIKNIQDFYRARGTEKASRFLMNILYDKELDFYYPKSDILKASDGKWFIERSLSVEDIALNNVSNSNASTLESFVQRTIFGSQSKSLAVVDRVERTITETSTKDRLFISYVKGRFREGETITTRIPFGSNSLYLTANVSYNSISDIVLTNKGADYNVGDYIIIQSANAVNVPANAQVAVVSKGEIFDLTVVRRGAGFQANNPLTFNATTGAGATGFVSKSIDNNFYHPNTYFVVSTTIEMLANTLLSAPLYPNLSTAIVSSPNINSRLVDVLNTTAITGLGPIETVVLTNGGLGYRSSPVVDVTANTMIRDLGILGKMDIIHGGSGYQIGDEIVFTNYEGVPGFGAKGNVRNIKTGGVISEVQFIKFNDELIGGSGYEKPYPLVSVNTANGSGAIISVSTILGDGESIYAANNTLGAIEKITINEPGYNYLDTPTANFAGFGDGTANGYVLMNRGFEEYEGRFLDDDGFVSSFNFLQDRDYYQNYSYVMIIKENIKRYRDAVKSLLHPAGMKLFGEYDYTANVVYEGLSLNIDPVIHTTDKLGTYSYANGSNVIDLYVKNHGYSVTNNVYIDFVDVSEFANKYYMVNGVSNVNAFNVITNSVATSNGSGQAVIY